MFEIEERKEMSSSKKGEVLNRVYSDLTTSTQYSTVQCSAVKCNTLGLQTWCYSNQIQQHRQLHDGVPGRTVCRGSGGICGGCWRVGRATVKKRQ